MLWHTLVPGGVELVPPGLPVPGACVDGERDTVVLRAAVVVLTLYRPARRRPDRTKYTGLRQAYVHCNVKKSPLTSLVSMTLVDSN